MTQLWSSGLSRREIWRKPIFSNYAVREFIIIIEQLYPILYTE